MKFYQQKYCKGKEKFYYLIPQHTEAGENEAHGFALELYSDYAILQDPSDDNTYLNESILIYDQTLGKVSHSGEPILGYAATNVSLNIILAPVSTQNISKNLSLEFGETERTEAWDKWNFVPYYINLYAKDICIGTCFYSVAEHCTVTYEWFRSYFENNLFVE